MPAPELSAASPAPPRVERRRRWRGPPGPPVAPLLPPGRVLTLAGRGETFVREVARSVADADMPIVLLHGWTASADLNWFGVYQALAPLGRVIALDHRGHGRGIRSEVAFTLEDAADDVASLLAALGAAPAVLVGFSMGGPIAMLTWRRHRPMVAGLVLEATALEWCSTIRDRLAWRAMGMLELVLRAGADKGYTERVLRRAVADAPDLGRYVSWMSAELRRSDPADMAAAGRALGRYDAREFAPQVDVPVSVVLTSADRLVPPAKQRALAGAVPGAVTFTLAGDHDAPVVQPEQFAATTTLAVRSVLGRMDPPQ